MWIDLHTAQCSALDQSFQVVYLWHNVAVGGVGILYMYGSLLRSKKGLQTLTMCGVLASCYIRFKGGGDNTAVNTEWNVV